jgi:hypothetical protein
MIDVMVKFVYTGDYAVKDKVSPRSARTVHTGPAFGKAPATPTPPQQRYSLSESFKFGEPVPVFGAPPTTPTPPPKESASNRPLKAENQVSVFATMVKSSTTTTTTTPQEKASNSASTTQDQVSVFATMVRPSTPPPETNQRETKESSPFATMVRSSTPPPEIMQLMQLQLSDAAPSVRMRTSSAPPPTQTQRNTEAVTAPITPKSTPARSPQREEQQQQQHLAPLSAHAKMFALGTKYGIPALQKQALFAFRTSAVVDKVSGSDLAQAILIAFNTGSDVECKMRKCVFDTLMKKILNVMACPEVMDAIERIDGLAMKVLRRVVENLEPAAAPAPAGGN